jgi:large subunit ribosomal protein L18e
MKKTKSTNPIAIKTIKELTMKTYEENAPIWRDIAIRISKPRRLRAEVNISKIARYTKEGDAIVVPGKVLGSGEIKHKVTVGAFSFSKSAEEKIKSCGGKCLSLVEIAEKYPKGNLKIIK